MWRGGCGGGKGSNDALNNLRIIAFENIGVVCFERKIPRVNIKSAMLQIRIELSEKVLGILLGALSPRSLDIGKVI